MSDEKVLTGEVDTSGWFIDPMTARFQLKSKKFFISVIHSPSLFSICSVQPPGTGLRDMHEDFEELDEEDARLILLSIKDSLDRALAGEDFELNIEPWPQRKQRAEAPEGQIWISTGPEADDGYYENYEILTNEMVKQFLAESVETTEKWWIDRVFDQFHEIEDAAAESFRKHSELAQTDAGCWYEVKLNLSQLVGLTDAAAESLGKFTGEGLRLEGLTQLSDAAAESLSNYDGYLWINLNNLPDSAVQILREGNKLTKEIVEQMLADEDDVNTSRFFAIEDAAAESLIKYEGYLNLDGLTQLSDAAAESLGKHKGDLRLNGLSELSDAAAESLGKHEGTIYLIRLTDLSDTAAQQLAKHPNLYFTHDNLPASAAQIFRDAGHR